MKCPKCNLELTDKEVIEVCGRLCPNKPIKNTSGLVDKLFVIDGVGFEVDGIQYLSGEGAP